MKILVTGATGFIGSHIVEELAKQGLAIRAGFRPGEDFQQVDSDFLLDGLDLDSFPLDITDRKAVFHQIKGVQILFHADYLFSWAAADKQRLYNLNHGGTRNLMEAALAEGVEKVIYTSGMETLSAPRGKATADERDGVAYEDLKTHFEKSRYLAEREVLNFKGKGLPTVVVHPTICLGSRERQSTAFGQYLQRVLHRRSPFYVDTGLNLVDVADVARGHLLAAKRGRVGGRYILGNQNGYLLEVLEKIAELAGVPPPKAALPFGWARLGSQALRGLFRRQGALPSSVLGRLQSPQFFNSALAQRELGFPRSNVWEALARQIKELLKK